MARPKQDGGDSLAIQAAAGLMLDMLATGEGRFSATEIQEHLNLANTSNHKALTRLLRLGLVDRHKSGMPTYYFLIEDREKHLEYFKVADAKRLADQKQANLESQWVANKPKEEKLTDNEIARNWFSGRN